MPEDRSYTHPEIFSKPEDTYSQREDIHNQRFFHSQRIQKAEEKMYRTRSFFTAKIYTQPKYILSQVCTHSLYSKPISCDSMNLNLSNDHECTEMFAIAPR